MNKFRLRTFLFAHKKLQLIVYSHSSLKYCNGITASKSASQFLLHSLTLSRYNAKRKSFYTSHYAKRIRKITFLAPANNGM